MPPTGFLAAATRNVIEQYTPEAAMYRTDEPRIDLRLGAAGGMLADSDGGAEATADPTGAIAGTGSLSAQLSGHTNWVGGCISGDLLDARTGAVHATAAGQFPLLITAVSLGGAIDRQIRLPLSARRELLDAPIDRAAVQFSLAFVDLDLRDPESDQTARIIVMPVMIEGEATHQDAGSRRLDRHMTRIEADLMRFVVSDESGLGELAVFGIYDETDDTTLYATTEEGTIPATDFPGITTVSIASLAIDRERWGMELDGGMLTIGGTASPQCQDVKCVRGFYTGAFRWNWPVLSLEGRAERTGFLAENGVPAYEDRATATIALHDRSTAPLAPKRSMTASTFAARARSWLGGPWVRSAGARVSVSQPLRHGISALVDGEVVRSDGDLAVDDAGRSSSARAMVSLAWQKRATKQ